jgi:hypothetical protein
MAEPARSLRRRPARSAAADSAGSTTGRSFQVSNIQVSRVRNGQIVASRDYHNHLVLAEVLGQLPMLLTALASEEPA